MINKNNVYKIIFLSILSFVFIVCGLALFNPMATNGLDAQENVKIHKNFDIKSANDGKYSDYLITEKGQYFSGGEADYRSGYLFEASEKGYSTSVRLLNSYSGAFNLLGQGFMENLYKAVNDNNMTGTDGYAVDYQRLAFVFTNLENPNQSIKLSFYQSSLNYLCLNIYYYDAEVGGTTAVYRQDNILNIASSFTGKSFIPYVDTKGTNRPLKFSYDLTSQDLNIHAFKNGDGSAITEHNLNTLFRTTINSSAHTSLPNDKSLPAFERYSVDMLFEVKSEKTNTSKFIVYELCGQTLAGENHKNTAGASIFVKPINKIISNFAYELPKPYVYDILDGDLANSTTCEVLYNGQNVEVKDWAFVPDKTEGVYTFIYTVKDSGGITSEKEIEVEIYTAIPELEVYFDSEILNEYANGKELEIPSLKAYSSLSYEKTSISYYTLVQKDSTVLKRIDENKNRAFKIDGVGEYKIIYVFETQLGVTTTETLTFIAKDMPRFDNIDFPEQVSINQKYALPQAILVYGETETTANVSVIAPDGEQVVLQDNSFVPMQVGEYKIVFSADYDGSFYKEEKIVSSAIGATSIIENVSGVVSVDGNVDLPAYSTAGNGIRVLADARNSTFRFANPIDLNVLGKDKNLIELQVLSGDGYINFTELNIELIDAENEQNVVKFKYRYNQWNETYSYVLLNYNGKSLGIRNEAGHVGEVDNYFGFVTHNSFYGHKYKDKAPFAVRVDVEEKQFFVREINNTFKMLLDADNPEQVGENIWSGFTSGRVYVQVTMQTLYDVGGVIVTEIAGQSLSGQQLKDEVEPNIYIEKNKFIPDFNEMPNGCVGYEYELPNIVVEDVFSPFCNVKRELFFKINQTGNIPIEVNGDKFTPDKKGVYLIVYTVTDLYGNMDKIVLNFAVMEKREVSVQFATLPQKAVVGTRYQIPEINVVGVSGKAQFEYVVSLNDKELRLSKNREVYLDNIGEIKIFYVISDYLEENIEGELTIPVQSSNNPIITIDGRVPLSVLKGENVLLPSFTAKIYSSDGETEVPCWIEVDGERIDGNSFVADKNKGEKINVKFIAGQGDNLTSQSYTITVIEPVYLSDYLVLEDYADVTFKNEKFYTSIITKNDNVVSLPNVVVCEDMVISFAVDPENNDFSSLKIKLFDTLYREKSITLTVIPVNENTSKVILNDNELSAVIIQASFCNRNNQFYFIVDGRTKTIKDVNNKVIFNLDEFENGDYFEGFTDSIAYMSFCIDGVKAGKSGSLELMQVGNQVFSSTYKSGVLQAYNDRTAPVIYLREKLYNYTVEYNSEIVIPAGWAYDVLGGEKDIKLTLIAPNGAKVIENQKCDTDTKAVLNQYGYYTIRYTTDNNGRAYNEEYYVKVRNRNLPQISVGELEKDTFALNEVLTIPNAEIINNLGNTQLYVFLKMPSAKLVNYTGKTQISFTEKGDYELIFYAVDEEYNVSEKVFKIKVS